MEEIKLFGLLSPIWSLYFMTVLISLARYTCTLNVHYAVER